MKNCSIIVSVYNEEASLENFFEACSSVLSTCRAGSKKDSACEKIVEKYHTEILFVDDGSTDRSPLILDRLALEYPELVKVIHFSRNFGHEAAMTAGLDYASGDFLRSLSRKCWKSMRRDFMWYPWFGPRIPLRES